jgi:uncharacterized Tic20 family protein
MAAHLSALVAVVGLPFGHLVGPLVVYLAKGGESPFVGQHARASLNYQLTVSLAGLLAIVLGVACFFIFVVAVAGLPEHSRAADTAAFSFAGAWLVVIGIALLFVVVSIVFIIMGTVAAGEGRPFTYPFSIRFLR